MTEKPQGRCRGGVVVCPVWQNLQIEGEFAILVHYVRTLDGVEMTAAYSRYNGVLTDLTEKMHNLKFTPPWQEKVANVLKLAPIN